MAIANNPIPRSPAQHRQADRPDRIEATGVPTPPPWMPIGRGSFVAFVAGSHSVWREQRWIEPGCCGGEASGLFVSVEPRRRIICRKHRAGLAWRVLPTSWA